MIKLLRKAQTMLSWRTPFWLFIFCVCAVVMTIVIVNLPTNYQGDVRSVSASLLPYNRVDANEIVIRFPESQTEIKCIKKRGVWYVDDGYLVRANADRISLLLNALMGDSIRERITKRQREKREISLADLGLEKFNTELLIRSGSEEVSITIGDDVPYDNNVFVKSNKSLDVYIVEGVLRDIVPTSVDEIRDRTLFPHSISLVNKIEIIGKEEDSFVIERDIVDGVWEMTSPVRAPASMAVDDLLHSISFASINSFVWHPVGNIVSKKTISDYVSPYGLDVNDTQSIIRVWLVGVTNPVEIRIGRPLPNDSGLVYAFSSIDNSVFTLDQTTIAPFFMGYEILRNHNIFAVPTHLISNISYKNGSELCYLSINESGDWEIRIPSKQPVEDGSVENFIETLRNISDSGVVIDDVVLPKTYIELQLIDKNDKVNQLNFYYDNPANPTDIYLKTTTSSFITRVHPDTLPAGFLDVNFAASFRSREIFNFEPTGIQKISLRRENASQSVYSTQSGEWRTYDKSAEKVESDTIISLINNLSILKAEWVAKLFVTDIKSYGFENPKAELTLVFNNDIVLPYGMPTVIVQIGDQLPTGGYFLRIKGEEELFIVSKEFTETLLEAKLY